MASLTYNFREYTEVVVNYPLIREIRGPDREGLKSLTLLVSACSNEFSFDSHSDCY